MKSNPNMKAIDMKTGLLECSDAKRSKKRHMKTLNSHKVYLPAKKKKGLSGLLCYYYC